MRRRTVAVFLFSVFSLLFTTNMVQAGHWGEIKWKNTYFGHEICLKGTGPTGYVVADYCNYFPQYQWHFNKKDKCLENQYYGSKCLTEVWDEAVLSPQNGPEIFTNEIRRNRESSQADQFYWLKEDTGEIEKWCLTIDDSNDPPWELFYRECHEDMHAQKFVIVPLADGWSRIMWKNEYFDNNICLKGTSPTGNVVADYCQYFPQYQWQLDKKDNCLENRYYGGKCLTEVWDEAVLSPRNGPETFTNEIRSNQVSPPVDHYYWLKENTGEDEKWCLTIDHSGDPPWDLYYRKCHKEMGAQKFVMDNKKHRKPKKTKNSK